MRAKIISPADRNSAVGLRVYLNVVHIVRATSLGVHAARALVLARPTPRPRIGDVPKRAGGWRDGTGIGRARSLGDPATPRNRLSHSSSLGFGMNMLATGSFAPSRNSNR
ncbi:unnamed protein product [Prorocentrum cordatum]|uniref:Uncharacterized protein n=1 Tax=Prorocentrum cordatum TaxID=2364126 RepID=A0ABN9QLZ0_9DINO|nr:unnamed protein product [Polarella glacialis]